MALCEHAPPSRSNLLKPVVFEVYTFSRTTDAKIQSSTTEDNAEDQVLKTFFSGHQTITGSYFSRGKVTTEYLRWSAVATFTTIDICNNFGATEKDNFGGRGY